MAKECYCKSCSSVFPERHPFCLNCWEKIFTYEEFKSSTQVWLVESKSDLYSSAVKAKDADLFTYILIESELSQKVSKAYYTRAKLAGRWKSQVAQGAISLTKAIAIGTTAMIAQNLAEEQEPDLIEEQESGSDEWTNKLESNIPWIAGSASIATDIFTLPTENDEEYKALPFALECDLLYRANFRLLRNASDYVVLRRERTILQETADLKSSTLSSLKKSAENLSNNIKKRFNSF